jgi:hypothetical protein
MEAKAPPLETGKGGVWGGIRNGTQKRYGGGWIIYLYDRFTKIN